MSLELKLDPRSKKLLQGFISVGKMSFKPVLSSIGVSYRKEVKMIFKKQQPRGEDMKWKALSEPYATRKERLFPGKKILQGSGRLYDAMTKKGAKDNVTIVTDSGGIFGESTGYGIYHDSKKPRRVMPLRDFSTPSDRRLMIFKKQITNDITKQFNMNGIKVQEGSIFV